MCAGVVRPHVSDIMWALHTHFLQDYMGQSTHTYPAVHIYRSMYVQGPGMNTSIAKELVSHSL